MHKKSYIVLFATCALFTLGCGGEKSDSSNGAAKRTQKKGDPETLVRDGYNQSEMDAAIARARREVDQFIKDFESKNGESFAVKAPIEENGETEHFWLTDVTYENGKFHGLIGNDPGIVKKVRFGQKWSIAKSDISDWMFFRGGKIHGNYTMRPLLKTMPKEEADMYRSKLANPDD